MKKLVASLVWRFRGIRVYALVGKSGTGKSFRARLLADKYSIDLMVDDGLLIKDRKIIAGRSAKREKAYLAAVKTALFTDKQHRRQARHVIEREKFKRILIIGTSERMVQKIADALKLPPPSKIIKIEEIATAEEIDTAIHYRNAQGGHVIPVPSIEVRRNYPQFMADSIKVLLSKGFGILRKRSVYEKSVVRPVYSAKGSVTISEAALSQMIMHCVDEFSPQLHIRKVQVRNDKHGYRLNVYVQVPFRTHLASNVHGLQSYIVENLQKYTGIMIDELNLIVDSISDDETQE